MLGSRVASAAVGIPLILGATYAGGWWLAALAAALSAVGAEEMGRLLQARGPVYRWPLRVWAVASALLGVWRPEWLGEALAGTALVLALGAAAVAAARSDGAGEAARWVGTIPGLVYPCVPLALLGAMRRLDGGAAPPWGPLWFVLFVVWAEDTVAYFWGRRWGRRRLAPSLSPGKTVEGAAAGLAAGALVGAAGGGWLAALPPVAGAGVGLVLGAAAVAGDLFESLLKRGAGVKDSGAVIPGHGGVLDRFDSLAMALPVAYCLFAWRLAAP